MACHDTSNTPLKFNQKRNWDKLCCSLPHWDSNTYFELSQGRNEQKRLKHPAHTLPLVCYPLIHAFIVTRRLVAPLCCLPYIFFSNYLSAQKPSPIWSAINYRLLISQWGGESMSVQVCFNLTEDFMIEGCKLIGFLTVCLDKTARLSKRDWESDWEGGREGQCVSDF